jgi:hypothetical protein
MADRPPRPQALTLTCVFVGVGCALLLLNLVTALSSWGSIALQDAVRDALEREPARELGLTMDQALDYLRYAAYVGVVLTASGAVFAVYAARGHRVSRIMLTVLCGIAFLVFASLGLAGLLPAAFAGVCAWSLWTPEARRWFDQVDGREVPAVAGATRRPDAALPSATPTAHPSAQHPSAQDPSGQPPASGPVGRAVTTQEPATRPPGTSATERPRSVTTAVLVTVLSCAVVALFSLLALGAVTLGADFYRTAMEQQGTSGVFQLSDAEIDRAFALLRIVAPIWLLVSVAGLVAAILTARRSRLGARLLLVLSAVTIGVSVAGLPLGVVTIGLAVLVIVQLNRPDAKAWLAGE